MQAEKEVRIFEGRINGVLHIFHAEEDAEKKTIHLVIFQEDDVSFNNKEEPRFRIMMKNEMPVSYDLQRSIGSLELTKIELTRIIHETLSKFGK